MDGGDSCIENVNVLKVTDLDIQKGLKWCFTLRMHACPVAKSCLTLCDPMECSPPGSSLSMGFPRQE